ncbi:MAG TPA: ATP-binding protein [Bacilli bacterium]|nr:ATP-binding protein [Bacilli bacterium]
MKIIKRDDYLQKLLSYKDKPDIKVITGVRRSGKSMLLNEYIKIIETEPGNINIIRIDYNRIEFDDIKEYRKLNTYIWNKYKEGFKNYLFIDEAQMCEKFEIAVNDIYESKKFDIYITGSNAFLLSSDLATLFTGRHFEIKVLPFSFSEYLDYFEYKNIDEAFEKYTLEGGFAGSYLYELEEQKTEYIANVLDVVILKDIMKKNNVTDQVAMENIVAFLLDNIANITSPYGITKNLVKDGVAIDHKTVGNYLKYLCEGFVFYKIKRFDIRGSGYLKTNEKYYLVDHGFRFAKLGKRYFDYGRLYENIVAIELIRRGYSLYVGKLYEKEIDFVAMKGTEKNYIQVADNITRDETLERELNPLRQIKDFYPKILIANTRHNDYDIDGIKVFDIARWLLLGRST